MRADPPRLNRRAVLAAPFALTTCDRIASAQPAPGPPAAPLKAVVPAPFGATGMTWQLGQPDWVEQVLRHCSQLTPEWEQKMERTLGPDFAYDFSASDRVVAFARDNGLRVHGHTLIWYSQGSDVFNDDVPRPRFAAEYDRYISSFAGRYRGQMAGWDVVNEPVAEDGDGLRDCHWSRALGMDGYMVRAFEQAHAADPDAVLFLNEYNLENIPAEGRGVAHEGRDLAGGNLDVEVRLGPDAADRGAQFEQALDQPEEGRALSGNVFEIVFV